MASASCFLKFFNVIFLYAGRHNKSINLTRIFNLNHSMVYISQICKYFRQIQGTSYLSILHFCVSSFSSAGFWLVWFLIVFIIGFCVWQRKRFHPWRDTRCERTCSIQDLLRGNLRGFNFPDITPSKYKQKGLQRILPKKI